MQITIKSVQIRDYKDKIMNWMFPRDGDARERQETEKASKRKTRVYVVWADTPTMELLYNATDSYRRRARREVLRAARMDGIDITGARWSRKAGCSCGCSPGFILAADKGKDIWIEASVRD